MFPKAQFAYDAATSISRGRRDRQEDAIAADFMNGTGLGFAVLADGMGGHAAGDIASKIVVTEVFSELKFRAGEPELLEKHLKDALSAAAHAANDCVGHYAQQNAVTGGMGSTLLAPVLFHDRLYWISVGDSPLYLFRDNDLIRLNEEHSLATRLDQMVTNGQMEQSEADNHPDRACLTSVLAGHDIAQMDCRAEPVNLRDGDIIIAASDGLLFLDDSEIAAVISAEQDRSSSEIGAALMQNLEQLGDPEQDNISFCVIKVADLDKVNAAEAIAATAAPKPKATRPDKNTITIVASASRTKGVTSYRISSGTTA